MPLVFDEPFQELLLLAQVGTGFIAGAALTGPAWVHSAAQKWRMGVESTACIADVARWIEPV
jgi:hypothetical protein